MSFVLPPRRRELSVRVGRVDYERNNASRGDSLFRREGGSYAVNARTYPPVFS